MSKQDEIAEMLYVTHCLFTKSTVEWESLERIQQAYWYLLADAVLELLEWPDEKMLKAALKEMRKPSEVSKKSWDAHHKEVFLRYWQAAIEAAKGVGNGGK